MKLYLVRHGKTEWNAQNRVLGRTDICLSSEGVGQAYLLSKNLLNKKIDFAFSSPLGRAVETCEIICAALKIPYEVKDELIEQDFGIFEGVDRADENYQCEKARFFSRYEKGESFLDVAARVYPFLQELKNCYSDKNVLIVTHNGICRIIHSYFADMSNEDFLNYQIDNCGAVEYDIW